MLANKKPYMEAHHLIQMSAQDNFYSTLEFADNIVCLCPNCHRKIHRAIDQEKRDDMIFVMKYGYARVSTLQQDKL